MSAALTMLEAVFSRAGWQRDLRRYGWTNGHQFVSEEDMHRIDLKVGATGPATYTELRDMMLKITGIDLTNLHNPVPPPPPAPTVGGSFQYPDAHRLKVRLNIPPTQPFPWGDVFIVRGNNKVNVVLSFDGGDRLVVLQDDAQMFPSDTLLGKMQLLKE